eukprot:TRINITY_DN38284_c0_g1_i1.p1 TRINITY_DN38284_c0_g1~~TRINITY_DN38284_c0_g1_i1.p1  ORF type:complete len:549 (-),score=161.41 TRINITY_DN38284_c0_g1_i1:26-1672(-)
MVDQKQMFRDDGSYDFKRREDWDYKHGYNFMAGWLGEDEAKAKIKKKKKQGSVDEPAPPIPTNSQLVETIEKCAEHVSKSADPKVFERVIQDKNKGKEDWVFMEEGGDGHDYYKFCLHCAERKVNPRPLAEQARKVKEDRERKQANANANVFAAGSGESLPKREAAFKEGETMEVLGVKSKPDYNGKIVKIIKYHADSDRYEVRFEGGRYDSVVVKLREENLMYSSVTERDPDKDKEMAEGEIPNSTRIEIRGLQSEAAKWMNGQKGLVVCWDKDTERYEVRLDFNNDVKKVKPANVRIELPEGWEELWDEMLQRHYYMNEKLQKVTWKHPKGFNQRGKFGKVRENNVMEWTEKEVEVDKDRTHYEVDDEEEGEGQFNLAELVKKVEEKEAKREAAEEAGEEYADSDDGMHSIVKQKKKKKRRKDVKIEEIQDKIISLMEHTMVGRASLKKDYTKLEGHFIAVKEIDPVIDKLARAILVGTPPDDLVKTGFEVLLGGLEKAAALSTQLTRARVFTAEMNKVVDRITAVTTPEELLTDIKWVSSFLKTT